MVCIDYQWVLSHRFEGIVDDSPSDLNALWFKFGGGVDYSFTNRIYGRLEALYGIRPTTRSEKDSLDELNADYPGIDAKARLGHGLTIKAAVGYQL